MYYSNFSLKNAISYFLILLLSLLVSNSTIVGSDDNAPLTRNQLQEKLDEQEALYESCRDDLFYMTSKLQESNNNEDTIYLARVIAALGKAAGIIQEDIKKLEEQTNAYDEENPDINSTNVNNNTNNPNRVPNNQNDNLHNPDCLLPNRDTDTPLYRKIIIGIIVVSLISFMAILIWESLSKKKKKKATKYSFSTLQKPKSV